MSRVENITDIMMKVDDIQSAKDLFGNLLNLEETNSGPGWVQLEDLDTHQRLVLTNEDFGSPWALATSTRDMSSTVSNLQDVNAKLVKEGSSGAGFVYKLFKTNGLNLLIYDA